jgi:hypothetical protein
MCRQTLRIGINIITMTNKGYLLLGAGVFLLGCGLFALNFPVFLDGFDPWGWQVNCGTGFSSSLDQASIADTGHPTDFVDACHRALGFRRAWTITLALVGFGVLAWLLVAFWKHSQLVSEE